MKLVLYDERDNVPMVDILLEIREECIKRQPCSLTCRYYNETYGDSVCMLENIIGSTPLDWGLKNERA